MSKSVVENLPPKERQFFRPAVINESIKEGYLNDLAYVFYPYGEKVPKIETEEDLNKHISVYYKEYLLPHKEKLQRRARKGKNNWWKLSEHRAWQRARFPKLVSTFFGKAGYFAWDSTGDFVVVQGHRWNPKSLKYEEAFYEGIGLAYLAVLCSSLIDDLLAYVSNSLGGGQWDLSQKGIQDMPLPDLFNKTVDQEVLGSLIQIGTLISQGGKYDKNALDQLAARLYRLPENTVLG